MEWVFRFILGLIAGSAANAIIYRLPRKISWFAGRSFCPECKHNLSWKDLIPLLSYLFLRGKCRYCHKKIPIRYFLVELLMGFGFLFSSYSLWWITVVIAVMDWETMLVSEALIVIWAISAWPWSIVGGIWGMGVIGGIWGLTRGKGMGFGDVEIAAVLGLWLGWPRILEAVWIAFILGGIVGVILLLQKKVGMKSALPFGPFLIIGGWIAYTWCYGFFCV